MQQQEIKAVTTATSPLSPLTSGAPPGAHFLHGCGDASGPDLTSIHGPVPVIRWVMEPQAPSDSIRCNLGPQKMIRISFRISLPRLFGIVRCWGYHPTSNWYWAMLQNAKKGPFCAGRGGSRGSPGVNVFIWGCS